MTLSSIRLCPPEPRGWAARTTRWALRRHGWDHHGKRVALLRRASPARAVAAQRRLRVLQRVARRGAVNLVLGPAATPAALLVHLEQLAECLLCLPVQLHLAHRGDAGGALAPRAELPVREGEGAIAPRGSAAGGGANDDLGAPRLDDRRRGERRDPAERVEFRHRLLVQRARVDVRDRAMVHGRLGLERHTDAPGMSVGHLELGEFRRHPLDEFREHRGLLRQLSRAALQVLEVPRVLRPSRLQQVPALLFDGFLHPAHLHDRAHVVARAFAPVERASRCPRPVKRSATDRYVVRREGVKKKEDTGRPLKYGDGLCVPECHST
eukprot:scaffold40516_cov63-Phaeocystis_antarctica.AAC.1